MTLLTECPAVANCRHLTLVSDHGQRIQLSRCKIDVSGTAQPEIVSRRACPMRNTSIRPSQQLCHEEPVIGSLMQGSQLHSDQIDHCYCGLTIVCVDLHASATRSIGGQIDP